MNKKILQKKIIIPILFLIIIGSYFGYNRLANKNKVTRYLTAEVKKGTIIVSVSGSGQVSALNQLDIKSKVNGEVSAVYAEKGKEVKTGKLIMKIDDTDYQKEVRDAETFLETANLELDELLSPPDELTLLQAENAVSQAKNSLDKLKLTQETEYQNGLETKQKAEDDIERAYEDALNTIIDAFWDLPTIITGVRNVLYSYDIAQSEITLSDSQENESIYLNSLAVNDRYKLDPFIGAGVDDYKIGRENYDKNFENYQNVNRYSEEEVIENLLNETIETIKSIAQSIKSEADLLSFITDYFSDQGWRIYPKITTYQSDLKSYSSKTNGHLSNLLSVQESLQDSEKAKLDAEQNLADMEKTHPFDLETAEIGLKEKEKNLEDLKAGPDELDIRAKKNAVQQKEDALLTAKKELADCYIAIPFGSVVSDIKIKKGDSVSAGTVLASLITQQKIAEISLNEVDVAKVKADQRATLTFDALPEVSISGKVLEIDTVGIENQGVVSYGVKIAFDTEEERIKPGMSVTSDIITDLKQDVLVLANSAVKSQGNSYYVELVGTDDDEFRQELLANVSGTILPEPPKMQPVEIGLSNDLSTEIVSGLTEGDIVITSQVSQNNQTQRTTQNQGFMMPGVSSGGGTQIRTFSR